MRWIGLVLVLALSTQAAASLRYMEGEGIPTTETLGGELITATIDWGSPETIDEAEYVINFGDDFLEGTFALAATTVAGPSAQLVYADESNGLLFTAISSDGPFSFDPATYVDTEGYGGFEVWTLTDTAPELNRYASITSITAMPEPSGLCLAIIGLALMVRRRG